MVLVVSLGTSCILAQFSEEFNEVIVYIQSQFFQIRKLGQEETKFTKCGTDKSGGRFYVHHHFNVLPCRSKMFPWRLNHQH